jgi:hypothetical protein
MMPRARLGIGLEIAWRVLPTLASFAFQRAARTVFRLGASLSMPLRRDTSRWKVLSADFVRRPLVLPFMMLTGPRWNTHALIATLGPIRVARELEVNLTPLRSARSWTVVLYSFPGFKTAAALGPTDSISTGGLARVALKPARYMVGLRCYGWSDPTGLPAIAVDGRPVVAPASVSYDPDALLQVLRGRTGLFYQLSQYYLRLLVKYKDFLPRRFVDGEFLPVGNPETYFHYGLVDVNRSLHLDINSDLFRFTDVYFTMYNLSSFPTMWCQVQAAHSEIPAAPEPRYYLLRLQRHSIGRVARPDEGITLSIH